MERQRIIAALPPGQAEYRYRFTSPEAADRFASLVHPSRGLRISRPSPCEIILRGDLRVINVIDKIGANL